MQRVGRGGIERVHDDDPRFLALHGGGIREQDVLARHGGAGICGDPDLPVPRLGHPAGGHETVEVLHGGTRPARVGRRPEGQRRLRGDIAHVRIAHGPLLAEGGDTDGDGGIGRIGDGQPHGPAASPAMRTEPGARRGGPATFQRTGRDHRQARDRHDADGNPRGEHERDEQLAARLGSFVGTRRSAAAPLRPRHQDRTGLRVTLAVTLSLLVLGVISYALIRISGISGP